MLSSLFVNLPSYVGKAAAELFANTRWKFTNSEDNTATYAILSKQNKIRFCKRQIYHSDMKINKSFMVAIFLILRISYENFRGFHKKFEELKIYAFDLLPSFYDSIFQKTRIIIKRYLIIF